MQRVKGGPIFRKSGRKKGNSQNKIKHAKSKEEKNGRRRNPSLDEDDDYSFSDVDEDEVRKKYEEIKDALKNESKASIAKIEQENGILRISLDESRKVVHSLRNEGLTALGEDNQSFNDNIDLFETVKSFSATFRKLLERNMALESEIRKEREMNKNSDKTSEIEKLEAEIQRLTKEIEYRSGLHFESNHKASREIEQLQLEIKTVKAQLKEAKGKIDVLTCQLASQEKKLLLAPRVEEQYLRAAKNLVKQKDFFIIAQNKKWKKLQGEVISMEYWKRRSCALQEEVLGLQDRLFDVETQNRLLVREIQKSTTTNDSHHHPLSRPSSARERRGHKMEGLDRKRVNEDANNNEFVLGKVVRENRRSPFLQQTSEKEKNQEVLKLLNKIASLESKIVSMSQQLAFARSYPLQSCQRDGSKDMKNPISSAYAAVTDTSLTAESLDFDIFDANFSKRGDSTENFHSSNAYSNPVKVDTSNFFHDIDLEGENEEDLDDNDDDQYENEDERILNEQQRLRKSRELQQSFIDRITKSRTHFSNRQQQIRTKGSFEQEI